MAKEMMKMDMCHGMHKKKGAVMLVLGLLILANAYWSIVSWPVFIGIILALAGLGKIIMLKK